MKLISSLVRPDKVDAVKAALEEMNVLALTVADTRDHSPQERETIVWMGQRHDVGSSSKKEIRVVVHDDEVDDVVCAVLRAARTGRTGDGHVYVTSVEHRYDIRTGERGIS